MGLRDRRENRRKDKSQLGRVRKILDIEDMQGEHPRSRVRPRGGRPQSGRGVQEVVSSPGRRWRRNRHDVDLLLVLAVALDIMGHPE
jgi:hypothetical protein